MPPGENADHFITAAPRSTPPASQPESLEVTYRLTARDLRRSYFQALCRHPRRKWWVLGYYLLAPPLVGLIFGLIQGSLFGITIALVLWLALLFYVPWEAARKAMRQHGSRGLQLIRISPENITGRSEGIGEVKYEWSFAERITETPECVAVHWKTGRTAIIPKRAFHDAESAARFGQAATAWHAAAARPGRATGSELTPSHEQGLEQPPGEGTSTECREA